MLTAEEKAKFAEGFYHDLFGRYAVPGVHVNPDVVSISALNNGGVPHNHAGCAAKLEWEILSHDPITGNIPVLVCPVCKQSGQESKIAKIDSLWQLA
ncbi:MAG: hypothetical protein WCV73_01935 [Patescibacteria group bacterium]|jgi:hypothetical protein